MNSKIDSSNSAVGPHPAALQRVKTSDGLPAQAGGAGPATAAVVRIDTLRLTGDALQLQRSEQALPAGKADAGRVAGLRQAVAEGRYEVDATATADKLMRFDWQLGAPR